jgi:TolB protein
MGHPEWSPDGSEIVLFAGATNAPQIYILRADGTAPRAVTQRVAQNLDPSWSPDGQSILFIGCPGSVCPYTSYEVYRIGRDGTGEVRLTHDLSRDHDPYFSPDGTRIAWLRLGANWGISSMAADGSDQRTVVSDLNINSKPAWAVDGSWIYFHRTPVGRIGFNVFRIRPDGTELRELIPRPLIGFGPYDNEYPIHGLH